MTLIFELPPEVEKSLRAQTSDLESYAKEAMLIELYRQGKTGHYELSLSLGIDRFQTDGMLKKHHVTEDLPTMEEVEQELATFNRRVDG